MKENIMQHYPSVLSLDKALELFEYAFEKNSQIGVPFDRCKIPNTQVILLESCDNVKHIPPVKLGFYALSICIEGESFHYINQHQFLVKQYTFQLVPPDMLYYFNNISEVCKRYILFFTDDFIVTNEKKHFTDSAQEMILFHQENLDPVILNGPLFTRILNIYEDISTELYTQDDDYIVIVRLLVLKLLFILKRRKKEEKIVQKTIPLNRPEQILHLYLELIEKHFLEFKKVSDYSPLLGITAKHLSETIKSVSGKQALFYIHQRILNEALYLLEYTQLSLQQISSALHYEYPSEFSRFFKSYYKMSPKKFRLDILKNKYEYRKIV